MLQHGRHRVILEHARVHEADLLREDLREVAHVEHREDARKIVENILLLLRRRLGAGRVDGEALEAALEQPRHKQALRLGHALLGARRLRLARVRDGPHDRLHAQDHRLEHLLHLLALRPLIALAVLVAALILIHRLRLLEHRHRRRIGERARVRDRRHHRGRRRATLALGGVGLVHFLFARLDLLGDLALERGELAHEAVQDAHEQRAPLGVVLVEDVFDQIEQQPDRGRLDSNGKRRVMDVAREDVDDAREVLDPELAAHVVHEVGERRARKRPERFV